MTKYNEGQKTMTDRQIEAGKKVINERYDEGAISVEIAVTLNLMLQSMLEAGKERTDE